LIDDGMGWFGDQMCKNDGFALEDKKPKIMFQCILLVRDIAGGSARQTAYLHMNEWPG